MDAKELTRAVEEERGKRRAGPAIAIVAFGFVALFAVVAVFVRPGGESPPATTPTTAVTSTTASSPTTVAEDVVTDSEQSTIDAFVDAVNDGDWEAFEALHDPGFRVEGFPFEEDSSPVAPWLELHRNQHFQRSVMSLTCQKDGDWVSCDKTVDGPVATAIWYRPMSASVSLLIVDGVIVEASWRCGTCMLTESPQLQTAKLRAWIESVDPEAAALLPDLTTDPATDEIDGLWADWAEAWVEAGRP